MQKVPNHPHKKQTVDPTASQKHPCQLSCDCLSNSSRSGLLKLWVTKSILGSWNKLAWQNRYNHFCKLYKKINSRPAAN